MMIVRQRMGGWVANASGYSNTASTRSTKASTIRSIATRTLVVATAASFCFSSSHYVPTNAFQSKQRRYRITKAPQKEYNPIHRWQTSDCAFTRRFLASTADNESISASVESTSHLPRVFVESSISKNALIPLTLDQEHYLLDVMRITNPKRWGNRVEGEVDYTGCIRVFNGQDGEWLAKVVVNQDEPKKRRKKNSAATAVVECLAELRPQNSDSEASLQLCFGYIKDKARRRWIFEKATELGVNSIQVLSTDFCNSDNYKNKNKILWEEEDLEKHYKHVIEAAEQSERLSVPLIMEEAITVDDLVDVIYGDNDEMWLVCRERSESSPPILTVLEKARSSSVVNVLIGPEGGWSPRELDLLTSIPNLQFVSLGSTVLRAETAAISAVASVQMHRECQS